jgi:hypothetical protein
MSTRAERFKAELQRSGPKREARKGKRPAKGVTASPSAAGAAPAEEPAKRAGRSQLARAKAASTAAKAPAPRKEGRLKSGRGIYVLETPQTASRPSRKSTRKSKAHVKSGTSLTTRTQLLVTSPARRHAGRS